MLSNVKQTKSKLWQVQPESGNTVHFYQKPAMTSEHAGGRAKLPQTFDERLQDMKSKRNELNMNCVNVGAGNVSDNQHYRAAEQRHGPRGMF